MLRVYVIPVVLILQVFRFDLGLINKRTLPANVTVRRMLGLPLRCKTGVKWASTSGSGRVTTVDLRS
jgi:hypothetical protein